MRTDDTDLTAGVETEAAGATGDARRRGGRLGRAAAPGLRLLSVSHAFARAGARGSGPVKVVCDATLTVAEGEIACLLGPSGCGKTTLLRLAAGLERLQAGRIEIGGQLVADPAAGLHLPPEARRVGLMFQDYALFPHLTVAENVRFGLAASSGRGGEGGADHRWAAAALGRAGLGGCADAYPHTLSGGQQQRCALLRAIAPRPRLLLLDEPFSGLDVTLRAQMREETAAWLRDAAIPTLIVTHDPEEAMSLADRLLVMRDGRIIQDGTPTAIYLAPADPFVASLFGPLNAWTGRARNGRVETPAGAVACPGLADGSRARVLIRPEGIAVDPEGSTATVVASRLLGCLSALTLDADPLADDAAAAGWRMRVLVSRVFLPPPGTRLGLAIDPARAFVFAAAADDWAGREAGLSARSTRR